MALWGKGARNQHQDLAWCRGSPSRDREARPPAAARSRMQTEQTRRAQALLSLFCPASHRGATFPVVPVFSHPAQPGSSSPTAPQVTALAPRAAATTGDPHPQQLPAELLLEGTGHRATEGQDMFPPFSWFYFHATGWRRKSSSFPSSPSGTEHHQGPCRHATGHRTSSPKTSSSGTPRRAPRRARGRKTSPAGTAELHIPHQLPPHPQLPPQHRCTVWGPAAPRGWQEMGAGRWGTAQLLRRALGSMEEAPFLPPSPAAHPVVPGTGTREGSKGCAALPGEPGQSCPAPPRLPRHRKAALG